MSQCDPPQSLSPQHPHYTGQPGVNLINMGSIWAAKRGQCLVRALKVLFNWIPVAFSAEEESSNGTRVEHVIPIKKNTDMLPLSSFLCHGIQLKYRPSVPLFQRTGRYVYEAAGRPSQPGERKKLSCEALCRRARIDPATTTLTSRSRAGRNLRRAVPDFRPAVTPNMGTG